MSERFFGELTFWNPQKGFGFIRCLSAEHVPDVFLHITSIQGRIQMQAGDIVSYEIVDSKIKPGQTEATRVRLMKRDQVAEVSNEPR